MTTSLPLHKTSKPLLIKSFLISALAHVAVIGYLYYNPLALQSPLDSLFGLSLAHPKSLPHNSEVDAIDKTLALEEVFHTILVAPSQLHPPHDFEELPRGVTLAPQEEITSQKPLYTDDLSSLQTLIDKNILNQEVILKEIQEKIPSPLFQALEEKAKGASHPHIEEQITSIELPFLEPIQGALYEEALTLNPASEEPLINYEEKPGLALPERGFPVQKRQDNSMGYLQENSTILAYEEKKPALLVPIPPELPASTHLTNKTAFTPHLEEYTFPKVPPSALWNEDFSVDVRVAPRTEGKGYLFAIT